MIVERVMACVAIMQRAKERNSLYMPLYQDGENMVRTEAELHACGNTACLAGSIAIAPEFHADGGRCNPDGVPCFENYYGAASIAAWLGIARHIAEKFIHGEVTGYYRHSNFYKKPWHEVTPDDVIEKLNQLLRGEL